MKKFDIISRLVRNEPPFELNELGQGCPALLAFDSRLTLHLDSFQVIGRLSKAGDFNAKKQSFHQISFKKNVAFHTPAF